jgi:hypothetical protein
MLLVATSVRADDRPKALRIVMKLKAQPVQPTAIGYSLLPTSRDRQPGNAAVFYTDHSCLITAH